eukprot:TRINITY_DN2454_c0_g1_i2.p1 TRINITY_DN2454_c0_g1~~TRINITY_DN2454_c0_g1_i2.p1  ORF type:complete len:151 (+),score=45.15 TRINITY_DN2454_c0_g1_i2:84-536(+)
MSAAASPQFVQSMQSAPQVVSYAAPVATYSAAQPVTYAAPAATYFSAAPVATYAAPVATYSAAPVSYSLPVSSSRVISAAPQTSAAPAPAVSAGFSSKPATGGFSSGKPAATGPKTAADLYEQMGSKMVDQDIKASKGKGKKTKTSGCCM